MTDAIPHHLPPTKPSEENGNLPPKILKKIDEQAEGFEGMFMSQMFQFMNQDVSSGEFNGGHGEDTWRGMLTEEYGKLSAKAGNLGIASAVKAEMIKAQEKLYPSTAPAVDTTTVTPATNGES